MFKATEIDDFANAVDARLAETSTPPPDATAATPAIAHATTDFESFPGIADEIELNGLMQLCMTVNPFEILAK